MTQMQVWNDAPLPALPDVYTGIYVRDGADTGPLRDFADELVPMLRPRPETVSEPGEVQRSLRLAFDKAEAVGRQTARGA
jgi:hypothetical protein